MIAIKSLIVLVPVLLVYITNLCHGLWSDFELISIINFNDTEENPIHLNMYMVRINRRSFGVSGTLSCKDYTNLTGDIKGYFKASPNDDFKPTVYKLDRITACDFMNNYYIKFLMKDLREPVSNYPQFDGPGPDVCGSMVNKNYTLNKFVFDTSKIPSFMQAGQYKMIQVAYDENDVVVSGSEINFRLF